MHSKSAWPLLALLLLLVGGCGGGSTDSVRASVPSSELPITGNVLVVNHLQTDTSAEQSDGPGPMNNDGVLIDLNATQFVYTGLDAQGTTQYGPITAPRADTQLLAQVPGSVTSLVVQYDDANGVQLDQAQASGVEIQPGNTITVSADAAPQGPADTRVQLQAVPAQAHYALTFQDLFANLDGWDIKDGFNDPAGSPTKYNASQVQLEQGGGVRIVVTKGKPNSSGTWFARSGRLSSKFKQKYGLFVFRARQLPKALSPTSPLRHLWPALWTVGYVDTTNNVWPLRGEIDVLETILSIPQRPDFTSRLMTRTTGQWTSQNTTLPIFPPTYKPGAPAWYASLPPDGHKSTMTVFTQAQWQAPHTFAVDWYPVSDNTGITDVMYDFYLDAEVGPDGTLAGLDGTNPAPKLKSYSLKKLVADHKATLAPQVPDWNTLNSEWGAHSFVLNVCVGGGWEPAGPQGNKEIKSGNWNPPTDGSADMIVDWVKCYSRQ